MPETIDLAEKRYNLRLYMDCALRFNADGIAKEYQGKVINLSSKGLLFTCDEKFSTGDKLDIVITPSNSVTLSLEASAVVNRVIDNDEVFEIACKINRIEEVKH